MKKMRYSVNFQGTRVPLFLLFSYMGGLNIAIHTPFLLFPLKIYWVDVIYYTIIIILELEAPIFLQGNGFALLIIFLGAGGLPIFLNIGT